MGCQMRLVLLQDNFVVLQCLSNATILIADYDYFIRAGGQFVH